MDTQPIVNAIRGVGIGAAFAICGWLIYIGLALRRIADALERRNKDKP